MFAVFATSDLDWIWVQIAFQYSISNWQLLHDVRNFISGKTKVNMQKSFWNIKQTSFERLETLSFISKSHSGKYFEMNFNLYKVRCPTTLPNYLMFPQMPIAYDIL